jgi:large subunit ribosomal protein L53
MKTTYLTTLSLAFNPFSRTGKVPRLFLTLLPPSAHKTIQIKQTQLPRSSTQPAFLELGFKDGKKMRYEWTEQDLLQGGKASDGKERKIIKLGDVVEEVDRHARMLGRKEELSG